MHTPITEYGGGIHHDWSEASRYARWLTERGYEVHITVFSDGRYAVEVRGADMRVMAGASSLLEAISATYLNAKAVQ